MAGFRKDNRVIHGFTGTDLADQDNVRRLAQGVLERRAERLGINTDFALGDDATGVLMNILNRILDGNDMPGTVVVTVTDQGSQ